MKRSRKLAPCQFLDRLIFNSFDNGSMSLNDLSADLQLHQGTSIRKQSLDERFNEYSTKFVKTLLEEKLKTQTAARLTDNCLSSFTSVKIKDSTRFQLPPAFKEKYPGCGGSASDAGMFIQFEFDLKSGTVSTIKPTSAKRQDSTDAIETVSSINEGELIIRDLGYFCGKVLECIDTERKAFFITRKSYGSKLYRNQNGKLTELELEKEYKAMRSAGIVCKEVEVYLNKKQIKPFRLIIEVLPDIEVERRIRKARENRQRKGKQLSKEYRLYASLGLFLTNIPKDWVKAEDIRLLYKLRWQVELRFKCWKGLSHIQATKRMKLHRFETCLYARLIYILIHWEISMALTVMHWKKNKILLSVYKCYKTLIQCKDLLSIALFKNRSTLKDYLNLIENIHWRNFELERRKNRIGFTEIMISKL